MLCNLTWYRMSKRVKPISNFRGHSVNPRKLRSSTIPTSDTETEMEHSKFVEEIFERLMVKMNEQLAINNDNMLAKFDSKFDELSERWESKINENNTGIVQMVDTRLKDFASKWEDGFEPKILEVQEGLSEVRKDLAEYENHTNTISTLQEKLEKSQEDLQSKNISLEVRYLRLEQKMSDLSKKDEGLEESVIFLNKEIETLKASIVKYKDYQSIDKSTIVALENKCKGLEATDEAREQHSRKMNLWVFGIDHEDSTENTWEVVKKFAMDVLNLEKSFLEQCLIKNTHRVGKKEKKEKPIIIAFLRWEDRMTFLKAASKLYEYNKKNNTRYGVKTDLAPKARALRKTYHEAAVRWRIGEAGIIIRPCSNDKGKVWMEKKVTKKDPWKPIRVPEKWFDDTNDIHNE